MSQTSPFFSICVPTRNRSETLFYCLKTLLHQNFESYEIIVSDNCDHEESEKTKKVIQDLASSKINYFKTGTVLSMTGNYEFALSKAKGKFILCIGDDDGLVVNSLQYVYDFIQKYDPIIVKSPVPWYYWINSIDYPHSIMVFPSSRPVTIVDSKSILEKVTSFELGYFNLPMIYYSFVSRTIVDSVVAEKGSFFQNTASIDMYSGFVIAYRTKQFHIADKPFAISGVSSKSNGASTGANMANIVSKEFYTQHNLVEVYDKYQVPLLPRYDLTTFVMLEIKKFLSNFNIPREELDVKPKKVLLNFLSTQPIVDNVTDITIWKHFKKYKIYESDVEFIEKKYLGKQLYLPFLGNNDVQLISGELIDPNLFDIKNVYDASLIIRRFIDGRENFEPVYISKHSPPQIKPKLVKRAFNRLKRSVNVLLGN